MFRAATQAAVATARLSRPAAVAACEAAPAMLARCGAAIPAAAASQRSLHVSSASHSSHRHRSRVLHRARALLPIGGAALVAFAAVAYLLPSPSQAEERSSGAVRGDAKRSTATKNQSANSAASTPAPSALHSADSAATISASSLSGPEEPSPSHADHAQCRACRDGGEEAISAYFKKHSEAAAAAAAASPAASASSSSSSSSAAAAAASPAAPCPPCFAYSHSLCPLNRAEVGRAAWGYLHTLAAYYPASPSARQQSEMELLLTLYMKYYPCGYCADRAMEQIEREPVARAVKSQAELSRWMCRMHNEVNERLGKPIFDCEFVDRRWRDGPPTGECD